MVNIDLGDDLLPRSSKLLPQPVLNLKHWEMLGCIVSTVATDVVVLKHQAISIHNVD